MFTHSRADQHRPRHGLRLGGDLGGPDAGGMHDGQRADAAGGLGHGTDRGVPVGAEQRSLGHRLGLLRFGAAQRHRDRQSRGLRQAGGLVYAGAGCPPQILRGRIVRADPDHHDPRTVARRRQGSGVTGRGLGPQRDGHLGHGGPVALGEGARRSARAPRAARRRSGRRPGHRPCPGARGRWSGWEAAGSARWAVLRIVGSVGSVERQQVSRPPLAPCRVRVPLASLR